MNKPYIKSDDHRIKTQAEWVQPDEPEQHPTYTSCTLCDAPLSEWATSPLCPLCREGYSRWSHTPSTRRTSPAGEVRRLGVIRNGWTGEEVEGEGVREDGARVREDGQCD
jgi:hypothetical protein